MEHALLLETVGKVQYELFIEGGKIEPWTAANLQIATFVTAAEIKALSGVFLYEG